MEHTEMDKCETNSHVLQYWEYT